MLKALVRPIYHSSPETVKKWFLAIYKAAKYIPFTESFERRKWLQRSYSQFVKDQRKFIFLGIARFCHKNRVNGYYFEFGSHGANTMRLAYDTFRHLFDWKYVSFDSFEGLPEIKEIDKQEIFWQGKLKTSEEDFRRIVTRHGMPSNKLITIKGFYDQSLNAETKARLMPQKAAVIYVDCDLYESTVPVLNFVKDFLQTGTVLVFDDWNCFYADPKRGERMAFMEFREREPHLRFEEFVKTNEAQAFIYICGERRS